ncbi:hypothetical protein HFO38_27585 [Rhizobium leguminosarum]|uniref:hypothetical protein n=1 Tax=Rhizobium leguminosarum TaxID=384 RepID=UPI001C939FCE|nr:hypothetical protein [Rhizobium leguminosarum]MBY5706436.1 hypothetical protein [Rhizobium leguminosarum]
MAFPERVCLRFGICWIAICGTAAELGAEFSAYRLDLALGALLQDLDRSGLSLSQADNQDGSSPRGTEQPLTVQVLCPLRTFFKELCTLDISLPKYPIDYDAGCAALLLRFGQ